MVTDELRGNEQINGDRGSGRHGREARRGERMGIRESISAAITSGSGRFALSSRLSSLSRKISSSEVLTFRFLDFASLRLNAVGWGPKIHFDIRAG